MKELRLDTLAQRVDRLERENRWWKTVGCAAITPLGLLTLLGANAPTVSKVVARRFVLVDQQNRQVAELEPDSVGPAALKFFDPGSGFLYARFGVETSFGAALRLYGSSGGSPGKNHVALCIVRSDQLRIPVVKQEVLDSTHLAHRVEAARRI
jgi:hypothetical protein